MKLSRPLPRRVWGTTLVVTAFLAYFPVTIIWHRLDLPTSAWEFQFHWQLHKQISWHAREIPLAAIAQGDWELACPSHGYDGDLFLKRYGKTFKPAGRADDGAWGLIFISPDGSHHSASGSCTTPGTLLESSGCIPRDFATLVLEKSSEDCPTYVLSGSR